MAEDKRDVTPPPAGRSEMHRRQRGKNIAMLVVLLGMVALFFVLTMVRMGGSH